MAWTAPRTWTTGELVTAAIMNTHVRDNLLHLGEPAGLTVDDTVTGFTNTSYADMDALTTDTLNAPVVTTADTLTTALVLISCRTIVQATSGNAFMSYRVSGASTIASDDDFSVFATTAANNASRTFAHTRTGLTAGANTFEVQARVSANSATIQSPGIIVIPLTT